MKFNIKAAIKAMRTNTSQPERQGEYWSEDEIENLRSMFYNECGITEIALTLRRTEPAIFQQIEKLDLYNRKDHPVRRRKCHDSGNDKCLCEKCSFKDCSKGGSKNV